MAEVEPEGGSELKGLQAIVEELPWKWMLDWEEGNSHHVGRQWCMQNKMV